LSLDDQIERVRDLQSVVSGTDEYRRAEARGELLRLPNGDGMALVFFRDPIAPVRCALEIASALQSRRHIELRMGVHSGAVFRVENINASADVSGSAINVAQRVMDCGDAGHILLSAAVADTLSQLRDWSASLHDL